MPSSELRNKVFKKLESANDSLLKELLMLVDFETSEGVFELTDSQKSDVDESRQQIKNGITFTNQEVETQIDSWLNK